MPIGISNKTPQQLIIDNSRLTKKVAELEQAVQLLRMEILSIKRAIIIR